MIESDLKRIADALERIADCLQSAPVRAEPTPTVTPEPEEPAAAPVEVKRGRGRPPKDVLVDELPPPPTSDPVVATYESQKASYEEEERLIAEDAEEDGDEVSKEMVRSALVELAKKVGQADARQLLVDVGGTGNLGALPEAKYHLVWRAAVSAAEEADR